MFCGDPLSKFRFILRRRLQHFQSLNTQRFPDGFCARFLHQRLVLYRHWSCDWTCLAIADSRCWPHGFSAFSFVGVMTITQQSSLLSNYASLPTFYMDLCKALVGHQKIAPFHRLTIFFWTGIDGCCSKGCHHSGLSGFRSPPLRWMCPGYILIYFVYLCIWLCTCVLFTLRYDKDCMPKRAHTYVSY